MPVLRVQELKKLVCVTTCIVSHPLTQHTVKTKTATTARRLVQCVHFPKQHYFSNNNNNNDPSIPTAWRGHPRQTSHPLSPCAEFPHHQQPSHTPSNNPNHSTILTTTRQHTRAAGSMHNLRCAAPLRTPGAHSVCNRLGWVHSRHQQQQPRRLPPAAATAGGNDDDAMPAQPDIDQLAAFLTQKAAEMRASMDEQDLLPPEPQPAEDAPPESSRSDEAASTSDTLLSLDSLLASADAAVPAGAALPGAEVRRDVEGSRASGNTCRQGAAAPAEQGAHV